MRVPTNRYSGHEGAERDRLVALTGEVFRRQRPWASAGPSFELPDDLRRLRTFGAHYWRRPSDGNQTASAVPEGVAPTRNSGACSVSSNPTLGTSEDLVGADAVLRLPRDPTPM